MKLISINKIKLERKLQNCIFDYRNIQFRLIAQIQSSLVTMRKQRMTIAPRKNHQLKINQTTMTQENHFYVKQLMLYIVADIPSFF